MRTKGTALLDKLNDSINEINRLISISYVENDYSKIIIELGGEIEKFLKSTVLHLSNKNFNQLIDELINNKIDQTHIDYLHDFRIAYNGYKHEPTYSIDIIQAKNIFINTGKTIEKINLNNLGDVNNSYIKKSKRVVWFAGWDDYIGGMIECNIFIPDYDIDMPFAVEHFNLDWDGWDKIIAKFTRSGELKLGRENVSGKAYDFWKKQSDFNTGGSFNGDISDFVRELTKHISSREKNLIPFLTRENDNTSVYTSIIFSLFDSLKGNDWKDADDLRNEIYLRSSYDYGINTNSKYLEKYINFIDLEKIVFHRDNLKNTDDILWLDQQTYNNVLFQKISDNLNIGFDKDYKIIAKIK